MEMNRLLCPILAAVARHRPAAASLLRDRSEPLFSCVPVAYSEPSLTGNVAFYGGWYWDRTSGPCCVRAVLYRLANHPRRKAAILIVSEAVPAGAKCPIVM